MDQIKRAHEAQDHQADEQAVPSTPELRTLNDLELVLCGGGDGMVTW
jgi:hypothetical protein